MRLLLTPVGSRGDVQPFVGLGVRLAARGHRVVVCAADNFRSLVESAGLEYRAGGRDAQEYITSFGDRLFNPLTFVQAAQRLTREIFEAQLAAVRAEAPDALVAGALSLGAAAAHELHGTHLFWAAFCPGTYTTAAYPFPLFGLHLRRPWLNRMTWAIGNAVLRFSMVAAMNSVRRELGLAAIRSVDQFIARSGPVLLATDPEVAAVPADWVQEGHATGYWFFDEPTPLPDEVEAFLADGPPPVYIGFGSMPLRDPHERTRTIVAAVEAAGARALLSSGWGKLGQQALPRCCLKIGPVSHAALFPRVAAVVHHAGAGTTAAALRAGRPQVPVPFAFDQPAWAYRVHELGVAVRPLGRRFSSVALAQAIRACLEDRPLIERSAALGARIRATDGAEVAARLIEARMQAAARPGAPAPFVPAPEPRTAPLAAPPSPRVAPGARDPAHLEP